MGSAPACRHSRTSCGEAVRKKLREPQSSQVGWAGVSAENVFAPVEFAQGPPEQAATEWTTRTVAAMANGLIAFLMSS